MKIQDSWFQNWLLDLGCKMYDFCIEMPITWFYEISIMYFHELFNQNSFFVAAFVKKFEFSGTFSWILKFIIGILWIHVVSRSQINILLNYLLLLTMLAHDIFSFQNILANDLPNHELAIQSRKSVIYWVIFISL